MNDEIAFLLPIAAIVLLFFRLILLVRLAWSSLRAAAGLRCDMPYETNRGVLVDSLSFDCFA
jgi:hypothetical protein